MLRPPLLRLGELRLRGLAERYRAACWAHGQPPRRLGVPSFPRASPRLFQVACDGGWPPDALSYISTKQSAFESAYPTNSKTIISGAVSSCNSGLLSGLTSAQKITGYSYYDTVAANPSAFKAAIAQGPVSFGFFVQNDFNYYSSGIYAPSSCPSSERAGAAARLPRLRELGLGPTRSRPPAPRALTRAPPCLQPRSTTRWCWRATPTAPTGSSATHGAPAGGSRVSAPRTPAGTGCSCAPHSRGSGLDAWWRDVLSRPRPSPMHIAI